jgi:hypothetical protein
MPAHDGAVGASDLLGQAVAELYTADPEDFVIRRKELAAQARASGDAATAKAIAGLAKPTRSAWVVNKLVHSDPGVAAHVSDLGARLRAGEASLDGARLRELSAERRQLVDGLVRRALATSDLNPAPAALREDIAATFNAALADPGVAAQLAGGALLRPARWAGFSPDIGTAVGTGPAWPGLDQAGPARPASWTADEAGEERQQLERERELRERERRQAVAAAQRTLAAAQKSADAATSRLERAGRAVQVLTEQLGEATEQLSQAQAQAGVADQALADAKAALAELESAS